jgi:dynein heavy chain
MLQHVAECFGLEGAVAEAHAKADANFGEIGRFLGADAPPRLVVFFRPPPGENKGDPRLSGSGSGWGSGAGSPATAAGDGAGAGAGAGSEEGALVFTTGSEEGILGKCIYFVRPQTTRALDLLKIGDGAVLCGEISAAALHDLDACLSHVYRPLFESRESWGKAGDEQSKEFLGDMTRFLSEVKDSLKSIVGGLELRKPDKQFDVEGGRMRRDDPELLAHYEELLAGWCERIEGYLDEAPENSTFDQGKDQGPMSELDYWRRRMQRLTNITEQIKTKECKLVVTTLSAIAKNQSEQSRGPYGLLRRWKQIDVNITEAANEAKDNEKYLRTLEKFIEVRPPARGRIAEGGVGWHICGTGVGRRGRALCGSQR